ncbi:nitroreductase family protein [Novosphingobium resinovorum]|uniref:Nitroreductase n=1 Tax=Novosphingobium resinovorum TaxID=158500 RepID=A0A031JKC3_9SPHN|nr:MULTISPECIES: nitroreductase family protein [Sphingomonadaceae]AOR78050.1 nitroreductase [Novosphingobium resinovorum]EJU12011.1 nitroreductase [Sphingomonas sp. LH128]EZP74589.1 Nitroreductase [Novosphingobium resinovorum]MBF7010156.1 nitroreductase family protein [Novosphingobium sp. HR1a]WJM28173.1 nitroreductase family protein [Novosphingobium resinovorum]
MTGRIANPKIEKLIVDRWSPRAFDGSEMPQEDLDAILEAGGWAPSAYNVQPWTFLYAKKGDANWDLFLSGLIDFNAGWAKEASAIVYVVSDKFSRSDKGTFENHSHSFDAGAAWVLAAIQAQALGYHTHGMTGLKFGEAEAALGIPEDHRLEAAFAIGKQGDKSVLPDFLQEREVASDRKPLAEIAKAGKFA